MAQCDGANPAFGLRRLSMEEISKHFTGVALEATPTGGFARAEAPPRVRLRQMLGRFTEDLTALQRAIRSGDGDTLHDLFSRTRAIRRQVIEQGQDDERPDFGREDH